MTAIDQDTTSDDDRAKLAGLFGFAHGLLTARDKVQMVMAGGLGVFQESEIVGLPGLHLNCDDGVWLRIERQRETRPPKTEDYVEAFFDGHPTDPDHAPVMKPALSLEVTIDEASDLVEAGLLQEDDIRELVEDGVIVANRVKIILHAENCPDMRRAFAVYASGPWSDWANEEKPVRKAINLYNGLFKINASIHTAEATPPELVWGIGIARWKKGEQLVQMPVIEQQVDIEVEDGGSIAIMPRNLPPHLSLKPFLELEIDGSADLQRDLQGRLGQILAGDIELSPFIPAWEPLLDTAASNLSSTGEHISRSRLDGGEEISRATSDLKITSGWAIFGRPRSHEARAQDIEALRASLSEAGSVIPASIRGFASPPPQGVDADTSGWGIDTAVLNGEAHNAWSPDYGTEPSASPQGKAGKPGTGKAVHFFPLPFNEEQGKISDMIDDPSIHVTIVSGPPGTGKSHSIANIISHQMATGKRVLVTARTPEAIAAIREKLPKSLQPLVIASVGTDRDSAQQLQEAVSELSNEVVGLDIDATLELKARLEQRIIACDEEAESADAKLGDIARANLARLDWNDKTLSPMDLVGILASEGVDFEWFTDRPAKPAPAQLQDVLTRLKKNLPELAADIVYAGVDIPSPDNLPTTSELISAHTAEAAWANRENVDYSAAPQMARDSSYADLEATKLLDEVLFCEKSLANLSGHTRVLAKLAARNEGPINKAAIESLKSYLSRRDNLDDIAKVRFDLGLCEADDFEMAAARGAGGQKPVGFSLFGGALKQAVANTSLDQKPPANQWDWGIVHSACKLMKERKEIATTLTPFIEAEIMPPVPHEPWDLARYLKDRQAQIAAALAGAALIEPLAPKISSLFPYGLDVKAILADLDCNQIIFALKANLPDIYQPNAALVDLRTIAEGKPQPIFLALMDMCNALGKDASDPQQIVTLRGEVTQELTRLNEVSARLQDLGRDLTTLKEAGAPQWASALEADPMGAPSLIPDNWPEAWAWAVMTQRVANIIQLGNGDEHRAAKAEAMRQRRKSFEELIRQRTLLGLAKRMNPGVRQAMEAFTQAISKIGTGKGKKAPRFIRAAKDAAQKASSAAPVWIMPEYKIPEQLPANLGDFDLVILDEASQSDVTAIAALARGKKILVVGDEKQVSPSAVGITIQKINALRAEYLDGLPNNTLIDESSSIFEIAKRMHPESHVMLREHFRCVAPIIQFSTRYYNNALVPLRVPKASERYDPPLADVYISHGKRSGKTNKPEAQWIVDEIARLIADPAHNDRDIGVISLIGGEQAELIGRMLVSDDRIGPDQIAARQIIYGDARTMQGQERSIVFLSMVATPGNVTSQSTSDAQQRFNVAMSRAKDRLYLVRSVTLDDLKPTDIKSDILKHFHDPMPDGRVVSGTESADLMDRCDSGFEREVLARLLAANYRVRPQVKAGGFSIDMVVEGGEDRRLAIELDGDKYHGPDVWDRDMSRQAALERAGWTFWRVFGSQWNARTDYWWRHLTDTLDSMGIEPIGSTAIDDRFTETIVVDDVFPDSKGDDPDLAAEDDPGAGSEDAAPTSGTTDREDASPASSQPNEVPDSAPKASPTPKTPKAVSDVEMDLFSHLADDPVDPSPVAQPDTLSADDAQPQRTIEIGSKVRLEKVGNGGGKMEITIVKDKNDTEQGLIGSHTPLGAALIGGEVGESVEYHAGPYLREVRVLAID